MKKYHSLSEALSFLRKKGFINEFIWLGTGFQLKYGLKVYSIEDCVIRKQIQVINAGDQSTHRLLVIMTNDGIKGLVADKNDRHIEGSKENLLTDLQPQNYEY